MSQETPPNTDAPPLYVKVLRYIARLVAVGLFGFSLMAIFPASHDIIWKATIGAHEYGAFLLPIPLILMITAMLGRKDFLVFGVAVLATCLLLWPSCAAIQYGEPLETELKATLGQAKTPKFLEKGSATHFSIAKLIPSSTPKVDEQSLVYDKEHKLTLDLYRPTDLKKRDKLPIVFAIHGGSWRSGDAKQLAEVYPFLAARGLAVAALNYRKSPKFPFPGSYDDCGKALAFLKEVADKHHLDASRVILVGRSAGGQLALLNAYKRKDPSILGVIAFYAAADLTYAWHHPGNPKVIDTHTILKAHLKGPPTEFAEDYKKASPIEHLHKGQPKTMLIHGRHDQIVLHVQSTRLVKALKDKTLPVTFVDIPWGTHACNANIHGPCGQVSTYAMNRFIDHVLLAHEAKK